MVAFFVSGYPSSTLSDVLGQEFLALFGLDRRRTGGMLASDQMEGVRFIGHSIVFLLSVPGRVGVEFVWSTATLSAVFVS